MPYPQIYPPEEEGYRPLGVVRTMFVDGLHKALAGTTTLEEVCSVTSEDW